MTVKSTITPEPAGIWLRVSTGKQDEQKQLPAIEGHCQAHGYTVAKRYELHGKSAHRGEQQDKLDEALADVKAGRIKVLVVWSADRLERRGAEETLRAFRLFREAGGRIESVKEDYLNGMSSDLLELILPIVAWVAKFEAARKQERAQAHRDALRAAGEFAGRPPWGYEPVKAEGRWTLVPTDQGRRLVPQVFEKIAAGATLRAVAAWLAEQTGRPWWPQVLRNMVTNPVYAGRQTDKAGVTILRCEQLVDMATFRRAGEAAVGPKRQGPPSKAMLGGAIFCPKCGGDSPMYKTMSGKKSGRIAYYRCWGRGPQRRGCGNAVRAEWTDAAVCACAARTFAAPVMATTFVPGSNHLAELAEIEFALEELPRRKLPEPDEDAERARLRAERRRLRALPAISDK